MPDLDIRMILFPRAPSQSVSLRGQATAVLVRPRANAVQVDPTTGGLTGAYRGEELSVHQRISEMADPLHFGTLGGFSTKVLWFAFGIALSGLAITGVCIYVKRVARSPRRTALDARRGVPTPA